MPASSRANSTRPVLSHTDSRARRIGRSVMAGSERDRALVAAQPCRRKRAMKKPSRPPRSARWQGRVRTSPSAVRSTGKPVELARARPAGARPAGRRRARARSRCGAFLRLQRAAGVDQDAAGLEHARPRPRAAGAAAPPCASTSAGVLCQAMSGWRRIVPVAVQGASSSTAPTGARRAPVERVGDHDLGVEPEAREVACAGARPACRDSSTAVTSAPAAASCAVLPPGAAHRSITARPPTSPSRRAGRAAAASCTHQAPSA